MEIQRGQANLLIDAQGHVLTKASELKTGKDLFSEKISCKLAGGKPRQATNVGVLEDHDLALLKIEATGLKPVRWDKSGHPPIGSWLATTGMGDDPVAIGVVSVASRKIGSAGGFLGVLLGQVEDGPNIEKVVPKSAAADGFLANFFTVRSDPSSSHRHFHAVTSTPTGSGADEIEICPTGSTFDAQATSL